MRIEILTGPIGHSHGEPTVFRILAASFALVLLSCLPAIGQESCSTCSTGGLPEPSCGALHKFQHNFFDCCKTSIFDYQVCDPCCRLPYLSFFGGFSSIENLHRTFPGVPTFDAATDTVTQSFEEQGVIASDGYGAGGAIGYRVHPMFRVETEFTYRENQADSWFTDVFSQVTDSNTGEFLFRTLTSSSVEDAVGAIRTYSGMVNGAYDFSIPRVRCLNLYLGGGIGLAYVDGNIQTATNNYQISSTSFAYQIFGGCNVPMTRRTELFVEYRYLGADNFSLNDVTNNIRLGQAQIDTHSAFLGVRFYPKGR